MRLIATGAELNISPGTELPSKVFGFFFWRAVRNMNRCKIWLAAAAARLFSPA